MKVIEKKSFLAYAGLPVITAALLILHPLNTDAFLLLRYEVLSVFGYIIAVNDIKTKRIANPVVLMMLAAWLIMMLPKLFFDTPAAVTLLVDSVFGFAVSAVLFLLVYLISNKGLGGGDVKFMAVSGLYLGFSVSLSAILIGTVLAALTGLTLILLKTITPKETIPLAPFLYTGMLITIFFT